MAVLKLFSMCFGISVPITYQQSISLTVTGAEKLLSTYPHYYRILILNSHFLPY